MDGELVDLGHRAVACKGWRWMPGMRSSCGGIVVAVNDIGPGGMKVVQDG